MSEFRIGFGFNNPDLTSNHYAPGWGLLVTPDELRYISCFGTKLVSSDASQTYTNETLQYYIDNAIGLLEADLAMDIFPRIVRYRDSVDSLSGDIIPRTDIPINESNLIREPGYPYRKTNAQHYLFIRLRRHPLQKILSAKLVDPFQKTVIDVFPWRHERPGLTSSVQFFPTTGSSWSIPFFNQQNGYINYPYNNFPEAFFIDYITGWVSVKDVPRDICEVVRKLASIAFLADFGDGRSAAVASQNASLNSVSESFSTTMSATNAMYGARILQWQKEIKLWYKNNRSNYMRSSIGIL